MKLWKKYMARGNMARGKTMFVWAGLLSLLMWTGCATTAMKATPFYTGERTVYRGDAADRVNLWPLAYWQDPAGSVAWPICSFSDDHVAFRPIYSQYRQNGREGAYDEFNLLWPLMRADTRRKNYWVFPFFWGQDAVGEPYRCLFPIYWHGANYHSLYPIWFYKSIDDSDWTFHAWGGLVGAYRESSERASWMFPLWYENSNGLLVTPVYGRTNDSQWFFPLWYRDATTFISLPYAQGGNGDSTWWSIPWLFTWGSTRPMLDGSDAYRQRVRLLLGLAGWNRIEFCASNNFVHNSWLWPLGSYRINQLKTVAERCEKMALLSELLQWHSQGGTVKEIDVTPLFWWEREESFRTLLFGWTVDQSYVTPFFGRYKGSYSGGWMAPIWSRKKSAAFDTWNASFDFPKLPDNIRIPTNVTTNQDGKTSIQHRSPHVWESDRTKWLTFIDNNRSIQNGFKSKRSGTNATCALLSEHEIGNRLIANVLRTRTVEYDLSTREKIADKDDDVSHILRYLYRYKRTHDRFTGAETVRHRVLGKLWDWTSRNGNISLDVFPGFTYDSKTNGFMRTSFLWRFFRYETTPEQGSALDILFLPVWR